MGIIFLINKKNGNSSSIGFISLINSGCCQIVGTASDLLGRWKVHLTIVLIYISMSVHFSLNFQGRLIADIGFAARKIENLGTRGNTPRWLIYLQCRKVCIKI